MKCTIIIPTYNRPEYLKRLLSYYDSCNIKHKIIIADSSYENNKIKNKEISSHFTNLNILHNTEYPSNIYGSDKFRDILNHVESEYSVFCADDDFITPNGITQSIDFLKNNPDYSVAHGVSFTFQTKKKTGNTYKSIWMTRDLPISITSSNPKSRVNQYIKQFSSNPIFYSVYRTEFLKMIIEESVKYTDKALPYKQFGLFYEQLLILLTLIHGKSKCLDIPHCARNTSLDSCIVSQTYEFENNKAFEEGLEKFKLCLTNHLKEISYEGIEEFNQMIDEWMYEKVSNRKQPQSILIQKMGHILSNLGLPIGIDTKIRLIYRKLFPLKVPVDFPVYLDNPKYQDDLNTIRKYVENRY